MLKLFSIRYCRLSFFEFFCSLHFHASWYSMSFMVKICWTFFQVHSFCAKIVKNHSLIESSTTRTKQLAESSCFCQLHYQKPSCQSNSFCFANPGSLISHIIFGQLIEEAILEEAVQYFPLVFCDCFWYRIWLFIHLQVHVLELRSIRL